MNEHLKYMESQIKRVEKEASEMFGGKCNPDGYHAQYISYTDIVSLWDNLKDDIKKDGSTWQLEDFKLFIIATENYILSPLCFFLNEYHKHIMFDKP